MMTGKGFQETCPALLAPPHHRTVHILPLFINASTSRAKVEAHRADHLIEGLLLSFKAEEWDRISTHEEAEATTTGKGFQETCPAPLSPPHHLTVHHLPLFITASTSRAKVEVHRAGRPIEGLLLSFEAEKASLANVIRCSGKIERDRISVHEEVTATTTETCPAPLSPPHHRTVHLRPLFITASTSRAKVEVHRAGHPIEGWLLSFEAEKASIANVIRCSGKIERDRIYAHEEAAAMMTETCPAPLSPPHHRTVHLRPLFITASTSRAKVEVHRAGRPIEGWLLSFEAEKASIANRTGPNRHPRIAAHEEAAATTTGKGFQETSPAPLTLPHHRTVHLLPLFITARSSRAKVEVHRTRRPIEGLLLSFEAEKASISTVIRCNGNMLVSTGEWP
ncbi:hypothetical protein CRG98_015067 [Punica granatum]|uniref:Uncharacterized protein n=1 Tax=Punica granatum TaxID=22663 RepID=A0A2I0K7I1_PUNGR|nr:hypothetical protein CRG98_015067 [Punica granatum]